MSGVLTASWSGREVRVAVGVADEADGVGERVGHGDTVAVGVALGGREGVADEHGLAVALADADALADALAEAVADAEAATVAVAVAVGEIVAVAVADTAGDGVSDLTVNVSGWSGTASPRGLCACTWNR
jgi:hypothetical protein